MDKDKIINEILAEWAMRSPDGLAGGYSTTENIDAFYDTMTEYGMHEDEIYEVMRGMFGEAEAEAQKAKTGLKKGTIKKDKEYYLFKDKNNPRIIRVYNRDKQGDYEDGAIYPIEIKDRGVVANLKTDAPRNIQMARVALKLETESHWRGMRSKKFVTQGNVDRMKAAIDTYAEKTKDYKAIDLFYSKYDFYGMDKIEDAMEFYSGTSSDGKIVKELIQYIDDGTAKAPTGRGEMVFVFILKNMTSGGNRMMDLVIAEARPDVEKFGREQGIEVKEATNKVIGISLPTLKGYTHSEFYKAITELINLVHKFGDEMLSSMLETLKQGNSDENYKVHEEELIAFFNDPKSGEISLDLIDALLLISTNMKYVKSDKKDGVMDIEIGGEQAEFDIENVPDVQKAVSVAKTSAGADKAVNMTVTAKYVGSTPTEDVMEQMKKIRFFREQITQDKIDAMVSKLMTDKYSKLLVVDRSASATKRATLYDTSTMNKLKFASLGFGKLYLQLPGATRSDITAAKKAEEPTET